MTISSSPCTFCVRVVMAVICCPAAACFSMSAICWRCMLGGVISAPRMMSLISLCAQPGLSADCLSSKLWAPT